MGRQIIVLPGSDVQELIPGLQELGKYYAPVRVLEPDGAAALYNFLKCLFPSRASVKPLWVNTETLVSDKRVILPQMVMIGPASVSCVCYEGKKRKAAIWPGVSSEYCQKQINFLSMLLACLRNNLQLGCCIVTFGQVFRNDTKEAVDFHRAQVAALGSPTG